MKEYLIVDGYNIINAWEELKELANINMDIARLKLLEILLEYDSVIKSNIIIVYDAHLVEKGRKKTENTSGIQVIYTKEGETADSYIERFVAEHGRKNTVKVATSDWAEQRLILTYGGARITPRELKAEILRSKTKIRKMAEKNNKNKHTLGNMVDKKTKDILEKWRIE